MQPCFLLKLWHGFMFQISHFCDFYKIYYNEKMKAKKTGILIFLFVLIFLGGFFIVKEGSDEAMISNESSVAPKKDASIIYDKASVKINESTFLVLIADTPDKRALGLSGRKDLALGQGMLFVFDEPGDYPFWMKDMNFSIDILWINENYKIVYILENVAPETYPNAFASPEKSLFVLELPMGTVAEKGIKKGDTIVVTK